MEEVEFPRGDGDQHLDVTQQKERCLLELCPRGNNKVVIIIILVHDNVYIPC
jgi:hypothetical protein